MIFVIDASVAVKWFVDEDRRAFARELLRDGVIRAAPDIIFSEVANALRKKVSLGEITGDHASRSLDEILAYLPNVVPSTAILQEAFTLSVELNHPMADCMYLACARHVGGQLVTDDQKYLDKARKKHSAFVVSLDQCARIADDTRVLGGLLDEVLTKKLIHLSATYEQAKLRIGRRWFEKDVLILAERGLRNEIQNLSKDQIAHVIAACWFGVLEQWEENKAKLEAAWARHLANARAHIANDPGKNVVYIISKLQNLEAGLVRLSSLDRTEN